MTTNDRNEPVCIHYNFTHLKQGIKSCDECKKINEKERVKEEKEVNEEKRSNYTLNGCWYCSDTCNDDDYDDNGNLINRNIKMCDVCRDHKIEIKKQDNEIGIDPTHCYWCGKYGSDELPSCFYCDRISCYSCSFKDKKRVRSCMSCHPLEITDVSETLYMRNCVRRFIAVNNNFIKVKNNNNNNSSNNKKRKLPSSNDNNKKQKKINNKLKINKTNF